METIIYFLFIKFEKVVHSIPGGYLQHDSYYVSGFNEKDATEICQSYFKTKYTLEVEVRSIRPAKNQNQDSYTSIITRKELDDLINNKSQKS